MEYRAFGNTGLRVSEIGLGCGPLGVDPDADYTPLLNRAVELGVNFYDTADFYSDYRSEEWLGRALASHRDRVVIATKFGTIPGRGKDFSISHMRSSLEESLKRLRTDHVDIYQLHSPPRSLLQDHELLAALQALKKEGKIRGYGISLDGGEFGIDAIEEWNLDSVQITFNLFHQNPAQSFFAAARRKGVAVIVKSPLDSGMLGGDLEPGKPRKLDDPRDRWSEEETTRRQRLFDEVKFLAQGTGRTWSQAALQFVLSFDAVSVAIPGTTSIEHLEQNVAAAGGRLAPEEMARLRSLHGGDFANLNLEW
ncbi:MAG TPA: aldo/keto reductase [Armatimonadota bacterium]|nr:aldo/keto reductase [Armatimonadota bacterium]